MTRKPRKRVVENIIRDLINSEIPEIQSVAKELADRTKLLEEHGWKLQHLATEIEKITKEEAADIKEEVSLAALVKDLENTLSQLRHEPVKKTEPEPVVYDYEFKPTEATEAEKTEPATENKESPEMDVSKALALPRDEFIITPEGFVVRKTRR